MACCDWKLNLPKKEMKNVDSIQKEVYTVLVLQVDTTYYDVNNIKKSFFDNETKEIAGRID